MYDFLAIKNPDQTAIMKVCDAIYSGPLANTSIRVSKDFLPATVNDTYVAKILVENLGGTKLVHLKQIHTNFIQRENWHELIILVAILTQSYSLNHLFIIDSFCPPNFGVIV